MSVQIYTGFKFIPRELGALVAAMEPIKTRIEVLQRQRYLSAYACIFVEMMDRSRQAVAEGCTEGMVSARPGTLTWRAIAKRQQQVRATRERDPAVDLEVVLTCWHSQRLGEVIGCVFGEFSEPVLQFLKDAGVATDFAYWTSSDPDENVTSEEWGRRKVVWNEVMDRRAGLGFQFRFDGQHASLPACWEDVVPHLPSLDVRSRELAEPRLFQRWYNALPEKREDGEDIWQLHSQFRKRLREELEAKQQLADEIGRIKPLLMTSEELDKARNSTQLVFSPCDD